MKTAVAQLGKDVESTAKIDPGLGFVERRQQKWLQVMRMSVITIVTLPLTAGIS
jgi:hypothetical protein